MKVSAKQITGIQEFKTQIVLLATLVTLNKFGYTKSEYRADSTKKIVTEALKLLYGDTISGEKAKEVAKFIKNMPDSTIEKFLSFGYKALKWASEYKEDTNSTTNTTAVPSKFADIINFDNFKVTLANAATKALTSDTVSKYDLGIICYIPEAYRKMLSNKIPGSIKKTIYNTPQTYAVGTIHTEHLKLVKKEEAVGKFGKFFRIYLRNDNGILFQMNLNNELNDFDSIMYFKVKKQYTHYQCGEDIIVISQLTV